MSKKTSTPSREPKEVKDVLATRKSDVLSDTRQRVTIGSLERALSHDFPSEDAEEWDHSGLIAGDPASPVISVAVALDPTVSALDEAKALGANVLVTHHPPFISPPTRFFPELSSADSSGAVIWSAITNKIALLSYHSALDVSPAASRVLPGLLNLTYRGVLVPLASSKKKGYGAICGLRSADRDITLAQLAARCTSVFGRQPRVYGRPDAALKTIVTATGSAGSIASATVRYGADCIVCGEMKYHDALSLSVAGVSVVELGHDVSELPLTAPLAAAVKNAGIDTSSIFVIDQSDHWFLHDATRLG